MDECQIPGGATLWARQTIESEIFLHKPDKWFKIWFYLVNRVSHRDTKNYKRGETFYQQEWICEATKATPDQVKKCLTWLRDMEMIRTRRSTRGTWLKIPNYSYFQTLDNYYYKVKAPTEAREKHERSTKEARRYNKNDKNDKNINTSEQSSQKVFNHLEWIEKLKNSKQAHIRIIGWYFEIKAARFPTEATAQKELRRWTKTARTLSDYPRDKILEAKRLAAEKYPKEWKLSTIEKIIPFLK